MNRLILYFKGMLKADFPESLESVKAALEAKQKPIRSPVKIPSRPRKYAFELFNF